MDLTDYHQRGSEVITERGTSAQDNEVVDKHYKKDS